MLPFGVTIPAKVPQRSEIPEGLTNYLVYQCRNRQTDVQTGEQRWTGVTSTSGFSFILCVQWLLISFVPKKSPDIYGFLYKLWGQVVV
jgi:hypothetical protein